MNQQIIVAMCGSFARQLLMYAVAKLGLSAVVSDVEIQGYAEKAVVVALALYSAWSAKHKLMTAPPKPGNQTVTSSNAMLMALLVPALLLNSGCAVVHGRAGDSSYLGFALGEKTSSTLAGLNITESQKEAGDVTVERGVGVDTAGSAGTTDMGKILGNLLMLGLQSQGMPVKASATASENPEAADAVAEPVATTVKKSAGVKKTTAKKPAAKKASASTPVVTATPAMSPALTSAIASAKATGKPLVVIDSSPSCSYCRTLEAAIAANPGFMGRTDIIIVNEPAEWDVNGSIAWTGGGAAPIVRITRWDSSGKIVCDRTLNRPSIAAIEAAISACSNP